MVKVIHIVSKFDIGGAEQIAFNIAKSRSESFEYHVVEVFRSRSSFSDAMIADAEAHDIKLHLSDIDNKKLAMLSFPLRLRKIVKAIRPDIIHTHTEIPDMSVYLSVKSGWCPCKQIGFVRTIHNNQLWNGWKFLGARVEKFLQQRCTNIAISNSTQESYCSAYGKKCQIIYNGVADASQFIYPELAEGKINILFAARMEYQKGIDTLMEIVSCYGNDSRFHFHIVGVGTDRDKVYDRLKSYRNVSFKDRISGLSHVLGSFDYLIMPSLFEGLALTPIEAAFAGTPTIINEVPGLAEIFPEDWPLKVRNNNIDEYKAIFDSLHYRNYSALCAKCKSGVEDKFTLGRMQIEYEKLYADIKANPK